ncbi:hypothetical protein ACH5RR_022732 [Cinchona calisaya]|uniref:Peptidase S59 domain-containing protein n=1 Tax=Cinchona calisaya TaxID=153742 RepID=A0ABD2ZBX1_9GENT
MAPLNNKFKSSQNTPFNQSSSSQSGSSFVFAQASNMSARTFTFQPSTPAGSKDPFASSAQGSLFGGNSVGSSGTASSQTLSAPVFGVPSSTASGSSLFSPFAFSVGSAFNQSICSQSGSSSVSGQTSNLSTKTFTFRPCTPAGFEDPFASSAQGSLIGGNSVGSSGTASSQTVSGSIFGASSSPASGSSSFSSFAFNIGSGSQSTATVRSINSGTSAFGNQDGGSRVASYTTTSETDAITQIPSEFVSISSMPVYSDKSHEELRSEDYQLRDQGGWRPVKRTNWFVSPTPSFSDMGSTWSSTCTSSQCLNPLKTSSTSNNIFSTPAVALSCNSGITQSAFGGELGGSRVACYAATFEIDNKMGLPDFGKLVSISAMPIYCGKSHEELRLEDYKSDDKGGHRPINNLSGGLNAVSSTTLRNPFSPSRAPSNPPVNPVFPSTYSNLFTSQRSPSCSSETHASGPTLPAIYPNPFSSSSPHTMSVPQLQPFGIPGTRASTPACSLSSSGGPSFAYPFWTVPSASATVSDPVHEPKTSLSSDPYSSAAVAPSSSSFDGAAGTTSRSISGFSCFSTPPSPFFLSPTPCRCGSSFEQIAPTSHPNMSRVPSTEGGFSQNSFSSLPCSTKNSAGFSQTEAAFAAFPPTSTAEHSIAVSAGASSQKSAGTNDSKVAIQTASHGINGQQFASMGAEVVQSISSNSFRGQPALQILVNSAPCSVLSIQLGISGDHASEKSASLIGGLSIGSQHASLAQNQIPCQEYNSKSHFPKVTVFSNEERTQIFKVGDPLTSKENPPPHVFHSTKVSPCNDEGNQSSRQESTSINLNENGQTSNDKVSENLSVGSNLNINMENCDNKPIPARFFHVTVSEDENGEVAADVGRNPDIAAILPKIQSVDYYTKPTIEELAASERAVPGFCGRVKDFVVGRQGYGSMKFLGETDVRGIDLESLIQFNHREVIMYMDASKKPPLGQGLNRPAEVTLLNVQCIDKNTGKSYADGPKVEKYREMLKNKAAELGAEMVSYDPIQGEWTFKVQHF